MARRPPNASSRIVSAERFVRLCRLVEILAARPQPRAAIGRRLGLDVRGFYRDLEVLRAAQIPVALADGRYALTESLASALDKLPFPDPQLTFGEARQLARGQTSGHRKLQVQIERVAR